MRDDHSRAASCAVTGSAVSWRSRIAPEGEFADMLAGAGAEREKEDEATVDNAMRKAEC